VVSAHPETLRLSFQTTRHINTGSADMLILFVTAFPSGQKQANQVTCLNVECTFARARIGIA
jgi:hypothetical protein